MAETVDLSEIGGDHFYAEKWWENGVYPGRELHKSKVTENFQAIVANQDGVKKSL